MDLAPDLHEFGWCPFAAVTGEPCILCGGTRAVLSVVRGDVSAAWRYNAALLVFGAALLTVLVVDAVRGGAAAARGRVRALTTTPPGRRVHVPMVLLFVLWWVWNVFRW